jgi:hypothetical protein
MGLTLPTRGPSGAGVWDDSIDADLGLIDAHDHSTGKGTAVPTSGININADLTFGSLYAPIGLHRITFASIVALSSSNKSLFVNAADNELYWRSNAGTNVKLTSGNALNVAAFTGGIGGDYTAVAAAVAFDDAGDRYTFKQNAGVGWARLASGDVRLFETGTSDTVFVGLAAPAALAGSYTLTMPLAVPGSTSLVQMDSAGVLTASNTVANAVTLSSSLSVGTTLGVTGSATVGGTLGVTGLITATAGVTAAANQHVTVSGTGTFKHGTVTLVIPPSMAVVQSGGTIVYGGGVGTTGASFTPSNGIVIPICLNVGDRISAIRSYVLDSSTGPTTIRASLISQAVASLTRTNLGNSNTSSGAGAGAGGQTLTLTATVTIASQVAYYLIINAVSGTDTCNLIVVEVDYDHP